MAYAEKQATTRRTAMAYRTAAARAVAYQRDAAEAHGAHA